MENSEDCDSLAHILENPLDSMPDNDIPKENDEENQISPGKETVVSSNVPSEILSVMAHAGSFDAPSCSFDESFDFLNDSPQSSVCVQNEEKIHPKMEKKNSPKRNELTTAHSRATTTSCKKNFQNQVGSSTQFAEVAIPRENLFRRIVRRYLIRRGPTTTETRYNDLELKPVTPRESPREINSNRVDTETEIISESNHLIEVETIAVDRNNTFLPSSSYTMGAMEEIEANRETWTRNYDFLLSIIGFAVDLANVWRFPYLCYKNGGGAFLIPYSLMLTFGAVPLFYMELILGQYNRQGPISVWRACPMFKGVGYCAVMVAFYVSFYYNVIIGWSLYFLFASLSSELPWINCDNIWNTANCSDSRNNITSTDRPSPALTHSSAWEYFHYSVLEMQGSEGLHEIGYPKWQLVICLFTVYCLLYLSLFKGVKSSGLVVWATATLPYLVLSILLVRGLVLPGAFSGIQYYLKPELNRLMDTQVWVDAAVQVFYSVGAGFGVHLSYASYNSFNNNCYRDCLITTAVNCFTSFFSGFVIFTYLGYMSVKQGIPISSVATEGPGLVFQVYPEAVATLPIPHLWSILFFFMLIMLGIDSAMGGLECVITGLMDEFCIFFANKKFAREIFTFCAISVSFCIAMINVTPGGIYMFHLFDTYSAGISLLCSALFEAIAVSWFYGLERFTGDVELMMGQRPGLYWRICWKFLSPLFLISVVVFGLVYHEPLHYNEYKYPNWAEWMGWTLALSSILMIPLFMIIQIVRAPGSSFKEKIAYSITPTEDHDLIKRNKKVTRFRSRHWLYV